MKKTCAALFAFILLNSCAALAAPSLAVPTNEEAPLVSADQLSLDPVDETATELALEGFAARTVRRLACYARNSKGYTFEAIGTSAPDAQDAAMKKCYSFPSSHCSAEGCRVVYLRSGD